MNVMVIIQTIICCALFCVCHSILS